jgi:hypothetical protein
MDAALRLRRSTRGKPAAQRLRVERGAHLGVVVEINIDVAAAARPRGGVDEPRVRRRSRRGCGPPDPCGLWIPAFAGMTGDDIRTRCSCRRLTGLT